jgi:transposase
MYIDRSKVTVNGHTYQRVLLRESYREQGKVKHRTIANFSKCTEEEIKAIELAFKHKNNLDYFTQPGQQEPLHLRQGLAFGAVWVLYNLAERIGLVKALGTDRQGKLALWQVIARIIDQGSRLSAVRLAGSHAACDVLHLESFDEDDLYANLAWLTSNQARIEDDLFAQFHSQDCPEIFLYDVTSSYLEGMHNALAAFGYNRDGKKGKKQIVIGLLCDAQGNPLSIEVFSGNTTDTKTMGAQIQKALQRFGAQGVTFVGDRGMIKGPQIRELGQESFHYITAITKPQIESLLQKNIIQMELFEQDLAEVCCSQEKVRYILRRNPRRVEETRQCRQSKKEALEKTLQNCNLYLEKHPKALVKAALKQVQERASQLKLDSWITIVTQDRKLILEIQTESLAEVQKLDGCYALKTDLPPEKASAQVVHDRYKDLTLVEQNFRNCKTVELEMRPVHVRLESSTRGHSLVVMLAYRLMRELHTYWANEDLKVSEGISQLSQLCVTEVLVNNAVKDQLVPEARDQVKKLMSLAKIDPPKKLHYSGQIVSTKKKLTQSRPKRCI